MDIIREFEKKAAECRAMARATRDRQSRQTWTEMAERWARLAESHPLARKPERARPETVASRHPEAA